jgi:RNA polymerase sigma-70 factor (ECF subfamily)
MLDRAAEGDEEAFADVVLATSPDLYRYAARLTANEELAAWITQEAVCRTLDAVRGRFYDARLGLHGTFYQYVSRLAVDALTHRGPLSPEVEVARAHAAEVAALTARVPTVRATLADMSALFDLLGAVERAAWVLRAIEGFTLEEAAAILGSVPGHAESAALRAQATLEAHAGPEALLERLENWRRVTVSLVPSTQLKDSWLEAVRMRPRGGSLETAFADPISRAFNDSQATQPGARPGAMWQVAFEGDREGPFATDELQEMLRTGVISKESFVWRPGFVEWVHPLTLEEFKNLDAPPPTQPVGPTDVMGVTQPPSTELLSIPPASAPRPLPPVSGPRPLPLSPPREGPVRAALRRVVRGALVVLALADVAGVVALAHVAAHGRTSSDVVSLRPSPAVSPELPTRAIADSRAEKAPAVADSRPAEKAPVVGKSLTADSAPVVGKALTADKTPVVAVAQPVATASAVGPSQPPEKAPADSRPSEKASAVAAMSSGTVGTLPLSDRDDVITEEEIVATVKAHEVQLLQCASEQAEMAPELHGILNLRWTILPSGGVTHLRTLEPEFAESYLAVCIREQLKRWEFPRHKTQGPPVTFPFRF